MTTAKKIKAFEKVVSQLEENAKEKHYEGICEVIAGLPGQTVKEDDILMDILCEYEPKPKGFAYFFPLTEAGNKKRIVLCKQILKDLKSNQS